jgi:hypothetical protein
MCVVKRVIYAFKETSDAVYEESPCRTVYCIDKAMLIQGEYPLLYLLQMGRMFAVNQ